MKTPWTIFHCTAWPHRDVKRHRPRERSKGVSGRDVSVACRLPSRISVARRLAADAHGPRRDQTNAVVLSGVGRTVWIDHPWVLTVVVLTVVVLTVVVLTVVAPDLGGPDLGGPDRGGPDLGGPVRNSRLGGPSFE